MFLNYIIDCFYVIKIETGIKLYQSVRHCHEYTHVVCTTVNSAFHSSNAPQY